MRSNHLLLDIHHHPICSFGISDWPGLLAASALIIYFFLLVKVIEKHVSSRFNLVLPLCYELGNEF